MKLNSLAKEYYKLDIGTTPGIDPTMWQASFNDGASWVPAIRDPLTGKAAWLVAGPTCPNNAGATLIIGETQPLVQLIDNPEIVIRKAPMIILE